MGNFIEMIINFLQSVVGMIGNFISGIVQMFAMIFISTGFLTNALSYMPAVLATVIAAVVSINVVYLIIGR